MYPNTDHVVLDVRGKAKKKIMLNRHPNPSVNNALTYWCIHSSRHFHDLH